jgi:tRNA nucleotidyltransferase/poly(A) polymerase
VLPGEGSPRLDLDIWDREGTSLEQDLARRDFTINAMAADLGTGGITDPFGGAQDLARRCLRATTPKVLAEDPLRVLRAGRLAAQLPGLALEPTTAQWAREAVPGLSQIAAERLRTELEALFAAPDAAGGLGVLAATGALGCLLCGRELGAGELERILSRTRAYRPELSSALAWTLCLTALSPPPTPDEALTRLEAKGWLARATAAEARTLLSLAASRPQGALARRRYLHRAGALQREALALAEILANEGEDEVWLAGERQPLADLQTAEGSVLADPPRLLSGLEAQQILGLAPSAALGEALRRLRAAQVDGLVRTPEEARAWLESLGTEGPVSGEALRP